MKRQGSVTLICSIFVMVGGLRATFAQTAFISDQPQLHAIEEKLRHGEAEAARRAAQEYTEMLVQRSGGTLGDHRAEADALSGGMASAQTTPEDMALAEACAVWAITEAVLDRREEARWHWYIAQNLSRTFINKDLAFYGRGGTYLMRNSIQPAETMHAQMSDVLDPVRPEEKYGSSFKEPVRIRAVYPRLPQDLHHRDRFSHVVFIQITVDPTGVVIQPTVMDAGFYPGLIYRAFEALKEWRYEPARLNGKAVSFRYIVPVAFSDDRPSMPVAEDGGAFPVFTVIPVEHALDSVSSLAIDHKNMIYVADRGANTILRANPNGAIEVVAGSTSFGFNGDGKKARDTWFNYVSAISLDERTGELFVADTMNYRIRSISLKDGIVRTVAGVGPKDIPPAMLPRDPKAPGALAVGRFSGDGGPAVEAELNLPSGVWADPVGMLFIADSGNHRVRVINRGTSPVFLMGAEIGPYEIATIAGNGKMGFSGDGGKAQDAELAFPTEIKTDLAGNLFIVDTLNQRIRKVDRQSGLISTVAHGYLPDPDAPLDHAALNWTISITGLSLTTHQELIYADRVDQSIHMVSRDGSNHVIYKALPLESRFSDLEATINGQLYVADPRRIGVLRLPGSCYGGQTASAQSKVPPAAAGEKKLSATAK